MQKLQNLPQVAETACSGWNLLWWPGRPGSGAGSAGTCGEAQGEAATSSAEPNLTKSALTSSLAGWQTLTPRPGWKWAAGRSPQSSKGSGPAKP